LKIGNVPNESVIKSMEMFRDHVHHQVKDLGAVAPESIRAAGE
jgi:hypothetical protein